MHLTGQHADEVHRPDRNAAQRQPGHADVEEVQLAAAAP
jgi:hypothetical protein